LSTDPIGALRAGGSNGERPNNSFGAAKLPLWARWFELSVDMGNTGGIAEAAPSATVSCLAIF
jgi:hypothetical protein